MYLRPPFRRASALVWMIVFAATGCAVLTQSQVDAVKKFAGATQNYGTLPGSVINGYEGVNQQLMYADVATLQFGRAKTVQGPDGKRISVAQGGLDMMADARGSQQEFAERAARADAALAVLDRYAQVLVRLTSDEFTDAVDASATDLGQSLDDSIRTYNSISSGSDLPPIGAVVAQAVSGAGRVFIRHRQTLLLQKYVAEADPVVARLTEEIETLVSTLQPRIDRLGKNVGEKFISVANANERLELETVRSFGEMLDRADEARALAAQVVVSARQYREAHAALLVATREEKGLAGAIDQIRVLSDQIKAARKLKSKFS